MQQISQAKYYETDKRQHCVIHIHFNKFIMCWTIICHKSTKKKEAVEISKEIQKQKQKKKRILWSETSENDVKERRPPCSRFVESFSHFYSFIIHRSRDIPSGMHLFLRIVCYKLCDFLLCFYVCESKCENRYFIYTFIPYTYVCTVRGSCTDLSLSFSLVVGRTVNFSVFESTKFSSRRRTQKKHIHTQ